MTDTRLALFGSYLPSTNERMNQAMASLERQIERAAQAEVEAALAASNADGLTDTEKLAITRVLQLKYVNGMDLAAVLLRARYVNEIQRLNLLQAHPSGYTTMADMARAQGISPTELSKITALVNTIFPFVEERLGIPIAQLWEETGKANMTELVPILVSIITGEGSNTASVRASVDNVLDDTAATLRTANPDVFTAIEALPEGSHERAQAEAGLRDTIRVQAVDGLLHEAAHLNNRQLRQRIRPERTPPVRASILNVNGQPRSIVMEIDDPGQMDVILRKMGQYLEPISVQLPDEPRQRQQEAYRVPEIVALLNLIEGRDG